MNKGGRPRLPVTDPEVEKKRAQYRKRSAKYYALNQELVIERKRWRLEDRKTGEKK